MITLAPNKWLSFALAFVGGYGDAVGFVFAKTFTGQVVLFAARYQSSESETASMLLLSTLSLAPIILWDTHHWPEANS